MGELELLQTPLSPIEKAELSGACQKVLTPAGMMLLKRALFQCDAQALAPSPLVEAIVQIARQLALLYSVPTNERLEEVAELFHRETGYIMPGKDCQVHSQTKRHDEWVKWSESKRDKLIEAVAAYDAALAAAKGKV